MLFSGSMMISDRWRSLSIPWYQTPANCCWSSWRMMMIVASTAFMVRSVDDTKLGRVLAFTSS